MLLTIAANHTELGYLLHKHPDKLHSIDLSIGQAHIFYPEHNQLVSKVALLLDIDAIALIKSRKSKSKGFAMEHYVNDRPYVAASFMSVALSKAFSTAMNGRCNKRPALVNQKMDLEINISVIAAPKGGEILIRKLFEPLGYKVELVQHELDEVFTSWGMSKYFSVKLSINSILKSVLQHLYVLLPVLDNDKHYFVSDHEIEKLKDKGGEWLKQHPHKEQIINRYLINLKSLSKKAMYSLNGEEEPIAIDDEPSYKPINLHQQRLAIVLEELKNSNAKSVLDLGCGEGKLLKLLLKEKQFEKITGLDISYAQLLRAKDKLHYDDLAPRLKEKLSIIQGALTYKDKRMEGYDAAVLVEVIEHMEEDRLDGFEKVVFQHAKPSMVLITTPNKEYNVLYEGMTDQQMRHDDHRFEWSRKEFQEWANGVAEKYNYKVNFKSIGELSESCGAPSQMGIFSYGN